MKPKSALFLTIIADICEGIIAGVLISLGGAVYLACSGTALPYARYIGAFLFPLALVCICQRGYALYTGKIGLILEKHSKNDVSVLLLSLLGNVLGTAAMGFLIAAVIPGLKETAASLVSAKLAQGYPNGLARGFLCGILVFLSVDLYRNNKSSLGIILCIPAFILSGYEHSIADMFYFAAAANVSLQSFGYIMMIIIGNSLGGLLIPLLRAIRPVQKPQAAEAKQPETAPEPDAKDDKAAA